MVSILVFVSMDPGVLYTILKTNGIIRGHTDIESTANFLVVVFFLCLSVEM